MRKSGMSINSAKSDARAYETNIQSIRERYEKWVLIMVLIAVDRGESVVCRIAGWAFCGSRWVLSVLTKNLANIESVESVQGVQYTVHLPHRPRPIVTAPAHEGRAPPSRAPRARH